MKSTAKINTAAKKPAKKKTAPSVKPLTGKARGLVIVITGNGKGKTTSAFGQAMRAVGQGYKVFIIQFMKGRSYGECVAAEKYLPRLTVRRCGLDSFVMRDKPAVLPGKVVGRTLPQKEPFRGDRMAVFRGHDSPETEPE